jgi:hypothetical protein
MEFTKKYHINGPNNIIRLEKGDKVLYIFGDHHLEPNKQTECIFSDDYENIDFDKFIFQFMKTEKRKQFDIFLETHDIHFNNMISPFRYNYINNFRKMFSSTLKKEDKTVKVNPKYKNFRLHFTDIRNTIILFEKIHFFQERYMNNNVTLHRDMKKDFEELLDYYIKLQTFLEDSKKINKTAPMNAKYMNKVLNRYSDESIKKIMNHIYQTLILDNLENIIKFIKDIIYRCNYSIDNKSTDSLNRDIQYLFNMNIHFYVALTDLYFIRRFLDKNYIKNSILYTGSSHLYNITFILVKYFDFKVTNVYYHNPKFDIMKKIPNLPIKFLDYINILDNNMTQTYGTKKSNGVLYQCTNLIDFPPNFT